MQRYDSFWQKDTKQNQHRKKAWGKRPGDTRRKLPESSPGGVTQAMLHSPARTCDGREQNGETYFLYISGHGIVNTEHLQEIEWRVGSKVTELLGHPLVPL